MKNEGEKQTQCDPKILDMFNNERYANLAYRSRRSYMESDPFPHIVLDDFLPLPIAQTISDEYPTVNNDISSNFRFHEHDNVKRHFLEDSREFSTNLKLFSSAISSRSFLLFLETITGLKSLFPDPYFLGEGANMTGNGGFLNIHVDSNWNQKLQAWRRCNVLFYFTKDWKREYEGNLELWTRDGSRKAKEIAPIFNRVVIFNTNSGSFHGQPVKTNTPEHIFRKVFSSCYYATEKDELIDSSPHFTKYNVEDKRNDNIANFETSPYSDDITADYLKNI